MLPELRFKSLFATCNHFGRSQASLALTNFDEGGMGGTKPHATLKRTSRNNLVRTCKLLSINRPEQYCAGSCRASKPCMLHPWLVAWLLGGLVGWLVGVLVGWCAGRLVGSLVCCLVGRLVGWLLGCLLDHLVAA